ncbi:probable LRR receptor-like serine/threonine-protein kinase At1g53440 [Elaeis guineensis]|uniref:probable LRR receptor-like serine/threonine-protein kinase At1g53440 n=1 Tax=Elaeis guineensis var. tenera TaxID=51953 RepID=UPI003C6D08ED
MLYFIHFDSSGGFYRLLISMVGRVSDWKGGDGKFPPLQNMTSLKYLVLRNLSISGELHDFIEQMTSLYVLDLSFNNLTGSIPKSFDGLQNSIRFTFLTNNMLSGTIPSWILSSGKNIDLSYNSFTGSPAPDGCQQGSVNLVSSYSSSNNDLIATCLRQNQPCHGKARSRYNNFFKLFFLQRD